MDHHSLRRGLAVGAVAAALSVVGIVGSAQPASAGLLPRLPQLGPLPVPVDVDHLVFAVVDCTNAVVADPANATTYLTRLLTGNVSPWGGCTGGGPL